MKSVIKSMGILIVILLMHSSCYASSMSSVNNTNHVYYEDTVRNWDGYNVSDREVIGNPKISGVTITTNKDRLTGVNFRIEKGSRLVYPHNLFVGDKDGNWQYMIETLDNSSKSTIYKVSEDYEYTLATVGRKGHPNGIKQEFLTPVGKVLAVVRVCFKGIISLFYDVKSLDVDGNNYSVGYAPVCANDVVFVRSTPEPATMCLFGFGLLCGAWTFRRMEEKQNENN